MSHTLAADGDLILCDSHGRPLLKLQTEGGHGLPFLLVAAGDHPRKRIGDISDILAERDHWWQADEGTEADA